MGTGDQEGLVYQRKSRVQLKRGERGKGADNYGSLVRKGYRRMKRKTREARLWRTKQNKTKNNLKAVEKVIGKIYCILGIGQD